MDMIIHLTLIISVLSRLVYSENNFSYQPQHTPNILWQSLAFTKLILLPPVILVITLSRFPAGCVFCGLNLQKEKIVRTRILWIFIIVILPLKTARRKNRIAEIRFSERVFDFNAAKACECGQVSLKELVAIRR